MTGTDFQTLRQLSEELEQARVAAEDNAALAQKWAAECARYQGQLERIAAEKLAAEARLAQLRERHRERFRADADESAAMGAEVSAMVEELQTLAEELEASNEALREANGELDRRVAERTADLAAANERLQDREERLDLALRQARAHSWEWDPATDRIDWTGDRAALPAGEAPPATLAEWIEQVVPEDREAFERALRQCAQGAVPEVAVEYRTRPPKQSRSRWQMTRGRALRPREGQAARLCGLTTDITELKEAESVLRQINGELSRRVNAEVAAREEAQNRLFQKQKLEALGQLTGGVAHDFNNLLAVISNSAQLLNLVDDEDRRTALIDGILAAAERGSQLTRRLLAFGRRQDLRPEVLDLNAAMGDYHELLRHSLRSDIEIELLLGSDLWPVKADAGELQLALLNLSVNARDAMPGGGRIRLAVRNRRLDDAEAAALEIAARDYVEFRLSDTGCGMSAEVLARAFEPFFTTKDVGQGTGLGLPQVYGFARQSGGTAHIDSRPGLGTTVTMLLPRAPLEMPLEVPLFAVPADSGAAHRSSAGGSVLVVEDDEALAALVVQMLQQRGYSVTRVTTAAAALRQLRTRAEWDLLFTDVRLPAGMSGLDLVREVRHFKPELPIVITTGYGGQLLSDALAVGTPVLRKPYRLEELEAVIAAAMRQRQPRAVTPAEPGAGYSAPPIPSPRTPR